MKAPIINLKKYHYKGITLGFKMGQYFEYFSLELIFLNINLSFVRKGKSSGYYNGYDILIRFTIPFIVSYRVMISNF